MAALLGGCDWPTEEEAAIEPDQFVEVMVALREAERESARLTEDADSAAADFARRREAVLSQHGVTEEDLRRFVTLHADDYALMEEAWERIAERLRYVPEPVPEDPSTAPPVPPDEPAASRLRVQER